MWNLELLEKLQIPLWKVVVTVTATFWLSLSLSIVVVTVTIVTYKVAPMSVCVSVSVGHKTLFGDVPNSTLCVCSNFDHFSIHADRGHRSVLRLFQRTCRPARCRYAQRYSQGAAALWRLDTSTRSIVRGYWNCGERSADNQRTTSQPKRDHSCHRQTRSRSSSCRGNRDGSKCVVSAIGQARVFSQRAIRDDSIAPDGALVRRSFSVLCSNELPCIILCKILHRWILPLTGKEGSSQVASRATSQPSWSFYLPNNTTVCTFASIQF